jgi:cyclic pyranopterin phosphate synthase
MAGPAATPGGDQDVFTIDRAALARSEHPRSGPLVDSYGRRIRNLRISVTDRCNFRCVYCMPAEGVRWLAREDILRFEEIQRLARLFVERYGVRTIRLTGGEPLVRVRIEELVAMIDRLAPDLDITMTTNGVLLRQKAKLLKEAGLRRLNVSLDTLHIDRFGDIARRDAFRRVMDGLAAAEEAGLSPIKLNVVVMKGVNDDEVIDFARVAREKGYLVRFIEFMPLDGDGIWSNDKVLPSRRIQERIQDEFPLVPESDDRPGPSVNYRFGDGADGGVGFISSVSQAFCTTCNRIRLTAEGGLRTCLFSLRETPLRDLMRQGASDDRVCEVIEGAIWRKEEGHLINQEGFIKPAKYMSQIGG